MPRKSASDPRAAPSSSSRQAGTSSTSKRTDDASPSASERPRVDWDAVDRDYRAGNLTVRELATKHGTNHATIVRRAKRLGLTRDLSEAVREATNARLIAETITKEVTKSHHEVTNTVLAAAEVNAQVVMGHRQELSQARALANALLAELQQAALTADDLEMLAEILAGEGAKPADLAKARNAVARTLGLGGRVTSIRALGETFVRLQAAERVAYGIEQVPKVTEDRMRSANPSIAEEVKLRSLRRCEGRMQRGGDGQSRDRTLPGTGGGIQGLRAEGGAVVADQWRAIKQAGELVRTCQWLARTA
jgi:hypothetical protein